VRDEDLDWEIYHALLDGKVRTAGDLAGTGYEPALVEASLCRLERYLLIERRGDELRALSLPEAILLCQARNEVDSPLVFENGVIRVKTGEERKGR
jgi:hypothetical protein